MGFSTKRREALASAKYWLGTTRIDPGNEVLVRRRLREAGADPSEIDTSEADLKALAERVERERLEEELEKIVRRLDAVAATNPRSVETARRIVHEGLTEIPPAPVADDHAEDARRLMGIRADQERLDMDTDVADKLLRSLEDEPDDNAIFDAAREIVELTNGVFGWANGEETPGDHLTTEDIRGSWDGIVGDLEDAGSDLEALGLDDACVDRLFQIHALRPTDAQAKAPAAGTAKGQGEFSPTPPQPLPLTQEQMAMAAGRKQKRRSKAAKYRTRRRR